jgi:hypothetical protein
VKGEESVEILRQVRDGAAAILGVGHAPRIGTSSRDCCATRDTSCGTPVFVVPWLTMRDVTQSRELDVGA